MDLSGSYFEYSGVSSRRYGVIFANVNTQRMLSLSGEIRPVTIFDKAEKRNLYAGESYEDSPIQFDAEIVSDNDHGIDRQRQREIEKWLFHRPGYHRLYVDELCDTYAETSDLVNGIATRLYLNCRLVKPEKIEGANGVVGYKFTVECDSCMAWQDEIAYDFVLSNASALATSYVAVDVDTDINDYVYPKVTIQVGASGGNISITNNTDDSSRQTAFSNVSAFSTIIMRGDGINYISGDFYSKFTGRNFLRLLNGKNDLIVTGNITGLTIEFQNRRYL